MTKTLYDKPANFVIFVRGFDAICVQFGPGEEFPTPTNIWVVSNISTISCLSVISRSLKAHLQYM